MSVTDFAYQPALGGIGDVCGSGLAGFFGPGLCPLLVDSLDSQLRPNEPRYWGAWTHRPHCDGDWCVYTNALVPWGQGISIITHRSGEEEAKAILDVVGSGYDEGSNSGAQGSATSQSSPSSPFDNHEGSHEVRDVKGKGQGVFARRRIPRGSVVITDRPVLLKMESRVGDLIDGDVSGTQRGLLFDKSAAQLSDPDRVLGLAQHDGFAGSKAENAANYNSFQIPFGNGTYSAVFPRVSRINHSCIPNCRAKWSPDTMSQTIWTTREIQPGEELTISCAALDIPMGPEWDWHHRQSELNDNWNFACACSLCSAGSRQRRASDERRRQFANMAREFHGLNHRDLEESLQALRALEEAMAINAQEPMLTSEVPLLLQAAWTAYRGGHISSAERYVKMVEEDMEARGFRDEVDIESLRDIKGLIYQS